MSLNAKNQNKTICRIAFSIIIIWLFIQGCLFSNKGVVINKGPVINIYYLRKT